MVVRHLASSAERMRNSIDLLNVWECSPRMMGVIHTYRKSSGMVWIYVMTPLLRAMENVSNVAIPWA